MNRKVKLGARTVGGSGQQGAVDLITRALLTREHQMVKPQSLDEQYCEWMTRALAHQARPLFASCDQAAAAFDERPLPVC